MTSVVLSRRALFQTAGLAALELAACKGGSSEPAREAASTVAVGAAATTAAAPPVRLNRLPRMVHEYFVKAVRDVEAVADRRRAALNSRSSAQAYVREVRGAIARCMGAWPAKTPLKPRVMGAIERDTYRIEKVIFESRPAFPVTANLYVPKGRSFPLPGVVGTCGHTANGKASLSYQSFAQGLARLGYLVLIYDPIGQGERRQYVDAAYKPVLGTNVVKEHALLGSQMLTVGESLSAWEVWDGIRAVDYLLSRPEVDKHHIGVTGNSGGGTQAAFLCGVDRRLTMAAPSCFITTLRRNLENQLVSDVEQYIPGMLANWLDESDLLAAMAPKPVVLLGKDEDFFDVRGLQQSYDRLRRLYALLGAEQNISLFVGLGSHGYSRDNREAMYRWFNRATGNPNPAVEPILTIEKDADLLCTRSGQVAELNARPAYAYVRQRSQALARGRRVLTGGSLQAGLVSVLRLPARTGVPDYRVLREDGPRGYPPPRSHATTYLVETEPGIEAVVYLVSPGEVFGPPRRGPKKAVLYVSHLSSDNELRQEPFIQELIKGNPYAAFYTCDVRGSGESRPNTCAGYLGPVDGAEAFYACHANMLDRPYVGQRTHDVLGVLDWLASLGHDSVHLVGSGFGALPATFAGVLAKVVSEVTLKNALTSWSEVAESETYAWPLSTFVFNGLANFDLPDCYAWLVANKALRQIAPLGPTKLPVRRATGW